MKKFLILVACFIFTTTVVAYAEDPSTPNQTLGILTDANGNTSIIKGTLIEDITLPSSRSTLSGEMHQRTYMYEMRGTSGEITKDDVDDDLVTGAYLTIKYNSTPDAKGNDLYILNNVSGQRTAATCS